MIKLVSWLDRIVQYPKRYHMKNNEDGTVTLIEAPGTVAEAGTPVSAENMNAIRNSILQSAPVSAVMHFARQTAPDGWLICNGSAVSRSTYSDLFAVIGTTFGPGNGSTTFNLPDLRGEFIRGWDNGRNIDPGRALGSFQDGTKLAYVNSNGVKYDSGGDEITSNSLGNLQNQALTGGYYFKTRPRNIALLACIKY